MTAPTIEELEAATAHRPTPSEMETLLHWWLIVFGGCVLACDGFEDLRWSAIPAGEWWEHWALNPMPAG